MPGPSPTLPSMLPALLPALLRRARRHPALLGLLRPLIPMLRARIPALSGMEGLSYRRWIKLHDRRDAAARQAIAAQIAAMPQPPLISVAMPAWQTPPALLRAAIASLRGQLYPHWQLCVVDDASPSPAVMAVLAEAAAADPRIHVRRLEKNLGIAGATNVAIAMTTGRFVALMDHDDTLAEHALFEVARRIEADPDAALIYSDEDRIDTRGRRFDPVFKPDFDADLLLAQNFVSHLGVYRRSLLRRLGGMRAGFEGSQDHDLALRVAACVRPDQIHHIPAILYHWRQGRGASFSETAAARCLRASRAAVVSHLAETGQAGAIVQAAPAAPLWHRIVRPLPHPTPMVSVLIAAEGAPEPLRRSVDALLAETGWGPLEILLVTAGAPPAALAPLLAGLQGRARLRLLTLPGAWHPAAALNLAAEAAQGSFLLILQPGVTPVSQHWLREMVSQAARPEIGAVGARLLDAAGRLWHAGMLLGLGGVAGRGFQQADPRDTGHHGRLALVREVAAVSGACLMLRRAVFEDVGGFDARQLAARFHDVDLCLRIRETGCRILVTPFAELRHQAPPPEPAAPRDAAHMRRRWGRLLRRDPFHNANLALQPGRPGLADPPEPGFPPAASPLQDWTS
ncbi:glycosyltransferase [Roseomonas sp. 18066]|uniref:glycosyltransferase n=1 Tax=Roseomonas sp. 18066 TaxID=2681412 RepID=UPI0013580086|nr:glycosyltransferase [Roseomonas sp. 18066]